MSEEEEFDWSDSNVIAVEAVEAIAVYTNPAGNIVIRQQNTSEFRGEDAWIVIPRNRVNDVIEALKDEMERKEQLPKKAVKGIES